MAEYEKTYTVYFLQGMDGDSLIKIGRCNPRTIERRLKTIQRMSPDPLRLVALINGPLELERSLHIQFQKERQHGEWFTPSPRIVAYIGRIEEIGGMICRGSSSLEDVLIDETMRGSGAPDPIPRKRTQRRQPPLSTTYPTDAQLREAHRLASPADRMKLK